MFPAGNGGLDRWRTRLRSRRRPGPAFTARRILGMAVSVLLLAGAAILGWRGVPPGPGGAELVGPASVVDADTIRVAGRRIRLAGIDAPESRQTCQRDGVTWACGRDVAMGLRLRLDGNTVRCRPEGRDRYDRVLAHCRVGDDDIGGWLVSEGMAVAYTDYSWRYLPEEWIARWKGRGLWAGRFERPEEWRRRNRN
jgi:endonuclease YncB( thermonuclease family)